jgi:hypothetical protein
VRRPGGDQDAPAEQVLRQEQPSGVLDDVGRLGQPPRPHPAARQESDPRRDHRGAGDVDEPVQVRLQQRVVPHVDVHRRRQQQRRLGRQRDRGQEIVAHARRQPRDHVGGGRRDDQQVGLIGELDVPDLRFAIEIEELGVHRVAGQRLEGQLADELGRGAGHDHPHLGARLDEEPAELRRLVGRDAAGDAEDDALALERVGAIHARYLASKGVGPASRCTP